MRLGPLHHVGYVVSDLDAARALFTVRYGLRERCRETMEAQGVEAVMLGGDADAVELLRPLDPDGPIARFRDARGEGLHHVAFAVDDLAAALADLRDDGAELIDPEPRRGLGGHRVAFVHPRSGLGALTELVEAPAGRGGRAG